jgi:glycosyltransferase involved in cell wall biosynthesis
MWNLLKEVVREHDVHVISLYESFHEGRTELPTVEVEGLSIFRPRSTPGSVAKLIREWRPDAIYAPWSATGFLGRGSREIPTVLDYVGPGLLERFAGDGRVPLPLLRLQLESFWLGDMFLTTTTRERFYLLGLLAASGRLSTRDFRPEDRLVHHIPMTVPSDPPPVRDPAEDGPKKALVVLLAGALLPWYDYGPIARSAEELSREPVPRVRFLVVGGNPRVPGVEARVRRTLEAAREKGTVVFSGLVPFRNRGALYNSADVALVSAPDTVENELSARTRVIDYMWARLPVLTRGGDEYSEKMVAAGAGFTFGPEPGELTRLLQGLAADRSRIAAARDRIEGLVRGEFNSHIAAQPFLEFLDHPRRTRHRPGRIPRVEALALWATDMVRAAPRSRQT